MSQLGCPPPLRLHRKHTVREDLKCMAQKTAVTSAGFLANPRAREAKSCENREKMYKKWGVHLKIPPPPLNRGRNLYQMRSGKETACSKSDPKLICERQKSNVATEQETAQHRLLEQL